MNNNDNTRAVWFIVAFLLAIAVFANMGNFLLLMLLAGIGFWVFRNIDLNKVSQNTDLFNTGGLFRNRSDDDEEYEDDVPFYDDDEVSERSAQREAVYRHALSAVENAGLDPDTVKVLAVDLGVIAFGEAGTPTVYRTWSIPENAKSVQPFVTLRLPTSATGRIRFELVDDQGRIIFMNEQDQQLKAGRNFIVPPARLPISDEMTLDGKWQLRISADGVLLATHRFEFTEPATARIRQSLGEDGEIRTDARLMMDESNAPKMSLDDLLSYQEEDEQVRRK